MGRNQTPPGGWNPEDLVVAEAYRANLSAMMEDHGLSNVEYAKLAGIDPGTVSNMKRTPSHTLAGLSRKATVLGVDPFTLFRPAGEPTLEADVVQATKLYRDADPDIREAMLDSLKSWAKVGQLLPSTEEDKLMTLLRNADPDIRAFVLRVLNQK